MITEGFVIRVTGYHGAPKQVGSIPYRSGLSHERPVAHDEVINQIDGNVVLSIAPSPQIIDYDIDTLIDEFQDEYGCKVNYTNGGSVEHGMLVYEFDMFEPAWPDAEETEAVVQDLLGRVMSWTHGRFPTRIEQATAQ